MTEVVKSGKYIDIVKVGESNSGKTSIYCVMSKDPFCLGEIQWYASWRCYAFFPARNTVFEKSCMQDITDFIVNLMEDRKKKS